MLRYVGLNEEEVIENLEHHESPAAQQRALAYLDRVKNSDLGWQMSIITITSGTSDDPNLKYFGFQVIEHYIRNRYSSASPEEQRKLREFLSNWIQLQCLPNRTPDPGFLCNKAAQIFALTFVEDFPDRWPSFFSDLIESLGLGHRAVDNYMRVLKAIDWEVVDVEVPRTPEVMQKHSLLKTAMRERAVDQLADSWYHILQMYKGSDIDMVRQCLEVIGAYVSWINIALIANDQFVQLVLNLLAMENVRESAVDFLFNLISKGMEPLAKVQLIETLVPILQGAQIMEPMEKDESDFTCKLSRFVEGIGLNLIEAHKSLSKYGTREQCQLVQCAIEMKVPLMLRFLNNEDNDVSMMVTDFPREYLHMLKLRPLLTEEQLGFVKSILLTVSRKMKYPESYRFEKGGEREACFLEYRRYLKVIFENIAALNKELVLEFTKDYVTTTLTDWQSSSFQEIEVAMSLMYYIGEALAPSVIGVQFFQCDAVTPSAMQLMMRMLVTSEVSKHPHALVVLQYLETIVRYDKFFAAEPHHLPGVLLTFVDNRGMRHPSCKVRSRCAFLFSRFIKNLRNQIQAYSEDVLVPLEDLLILSMSPNSNSSEIPWVSHDDQLFLYEAAAILIVSSSRSSPQIGEGFRKLLLPALTKFNSWMVDLQVESDEGKWESLAQHLCHVMAITSRTSKAFASYADVRSSGCVPVYIEALQIFLPCLQIPKASSTLKAGIRQFLHRMVICLEEDLLPYIPQASQGLLKNSDIINLQEYLPLIIQIISKFKKDVMPFLKHVFRPIVNEICGSVSTPIEENDLQAKNEKEILQRNYFYLVSAIVSNDVIEVLKAQDSSFVEQVMMSVIRGAADFPDPLAQKCCFGILRNLVTIWGSDSDPNGFTEFIYKNIVPACFLGPMKPTFDMRDPVTISALNECAMCMKAIHEKRGNELINYLQNEYLPTLHMAPQHINKFCETLAADKKVFKAYLKQFFELARA